MQARAERAVEQDTVTGVTIVIVTGLPAPTPRARTASRHRRGHTPTCPRRWTSWSTRTTRGPDVPAALDVEERAAAGGGPAARASCQRRWWAGCCPTPATACRPTARPWRAPQHPDRDAQFRYINARSAAFQAARQPVISVDTKKKELVGDFKNGGREWRPTGQPEPVRVHDFIIRERQGDPLRRLRPRANAGWVSVGIDHDTAEFAVHDPPVVAQMGRQRYPDADRLLITADAAAPTAPSACGRWSCSRSPTRPAWRSRLPLPPGTSKWNKIEHRLFSFITMNWRGRP